MRHDRSLTVVLLLALSLDSSCYAFSAYQRSSSFATSQAASSGASSSSSATAAASYRSSCCSLNSWAYSHLDEVRQLANRLRQEYNTISQGVGFVNVNAIPFRANLLALSGKSASELDQLSRQLSQQIVSDMRSGYLSYHTIAQTNFFESKAAELLQRYVHEQQQHQTLELEHFQPIDLTNFDEVKNYAYPAEVKVIDGKTYVVHTNCTEAVKSSDGIANYINPAHISVIKHNRTVVTTNTGPSPSAYYAKTPLISRKKTIHDWVRENMEPSVLDYRPIINLGEAAGAQLQAATAPSSTLHVRRYNKTVTTNADGTNSVAQSESEQKWIDGKLVYDNQRPFGASTVKSDEAWKREERERFFWFLTQNSKSQQQLEAWQRQQEERLLAMARRYHTTIEAIQEFHRQELDRYKVLLRQYQSQLNDAKYWQRLERGRLDWLIHQNSLTQEDLQRWQRENQDRLAQLAHQYRISLDELKRWQNDEVQRLYVYFNDINKSLITHPAADSLVSNSEQERLDALIRQHNETIAQLQTSIQLDQRKLNELATKYRGNVQDMDKWLKEELARIGGLIKQQNDEIQRLSEWQRVERVRLEQILKQHQGSVGDLELQVARDRSYIQSLAAKYHVSIEELENWQRTELARLQSEGQTQLELNIKEWQLRERERLRTIVAKNEYTIEELQKQIMGDRARLESLARLYKTQVHEIEDWIVNEIKNFEKAGLLKEVEKELALWQQRERERLQQIVQGNAFTVEQLEQKIKNDQMHFYELANTYQVGIDEIQQWLKQEMLRLRSEGLIKVEELKDWQLRERADILKIVQGNRLTIEDFEKRLLADRQHLQDLSKTYNVQVSEIENWIQTEGERLQDLGLLKMQEQLNNWQKIERQRLLDLINKNNLSIDELEAKIKKDQVHLYSLAHQHQVRVEEIEEWIKQQIKKLQAEGVIEMQKLKDWQLEWRGNLTNMVQERDFTVEEFHKWLLEDRARLQNLAMQHNVQIEDIESWVKKEEQRFVSMGLLKPSEKLTNWQQVERLYLERLAQQQYKSTEQLEARLRQDRELLQKMARDYSVQVEEIERWMKQELARLRDDGQLQIDNLTAWQLAERERLESLVKQNKQWSAAEFEAALRKDREHMQAMAFQYHTTVEEIEKWTQSEIQRLKQQGKLDMEKLTAWQKAEHQRILSLLQQQSTITVEEFEQKVQQDRRFLNNLADQYHISVDEVEIYVKKVIEDLRKQGQFQIEKLQTWQLVERDYIKQLIAQYNNGLSTVEYEQKLLQDRAHLNQLAEQYRVSVVQIEKWMIDELKRLRGETDTELKKLTAWQVAEIERLKQLLREHNHLSYVDFELELLNERARLDQLAKQYSVNVLEIEKWLREQLINLKTTGTTKVENLTQWQSMEQQRLIELLLKQQNDLSYSEFEHQLQSDRSRLQELSQHYHVSITQIEQWMHDELQRLKDSGLVQLEHLTYWQRDTRKRLEDWLRQQHNGATFEEFVEFLKRDKARLANIAHEYHVTVEEVEKWVQKEGARLQLIGVIQRPESYDLIDEYTKIWQHQPGYSHVISDSDQELWKQQTFAHLQAMALVKPMSWTQFEEYLVENRPRWEQFARQYDITVEEIDVWLRKSAEKLSKEGLITDTIVLEEWQEFERRYIDDLINQQLRKQQKWTLAELRRELLSDRERLLNLVTKYHITIEQLEQWYNEELQRLLDQRRILSEQLLDWQRIEKQRLYEYARQRPDLSVHVIEEQLLSAQLDLERRAKEYFITVEELKIFIRNELRRLGELGLIVEQQNYNRWQDEERQRLRTIARDITITEEELLAFISNDEHYQVMLARMYDITLQKLAPFQRIEISSMQEEKLFENIKLKTLQPWQMRERDRLYEMIKNQNLSLKNLRDWLRQSILLNQLARNYGISVHELKAWQLREFERLMQLAEHYEMSLYELQDFRDKELRYITYVMHKKTSTERERQNWSQNEAQRALQLQRKTNLSGEELLAWRRTLYLLCQGLIEQNFGGYGGQDIGPSSTNVTALPKQIISKDRGDQPPHIYEEDVEEEPGLEAQTPGHIIESTTSPNYYLPPATPLPVVKIPASGGVESGYIYTKKEYKLTVPASGAEGVQATASRMQPRSLGSQEQEQEEIEDLGQQQQQQEEVEEIEDLGKLQESDEQQVQIEDLSGWEKHQQLPQTTQKSKEYVSEAVTEPTGGLWYNIKKKTTDLFG